jgi:paraquat-inducible protein B
MTDSDDEIPPGQVRRPRFSVFWIIPIIAAIIAGYLGYRTLTENGPLLTLTFDTADGLSAGQTQLEYKSLPLGTVEDLSFGKDHKYVIVGVRMTRVGVPFMTSHARFWVVRPNISAAGISGLSTLVSGSYITLDPGPPGGTYQNEFTGLEQPPGVRSDQPGSTFILKANEIGSLDSGSPVFYRDVEVGEVLGYSIGNGVGPVTINIFVNAPYDKLVRQQSHFWNSSGVTVSLKGGSFHIVVQSLQAVITGGVTFDLPPEGLNSPPSPANAVFPLYDTQDDAEAAGYSRKVPLVTYFQSSVSGLAPGAPVEVLGLEVGQVTDVKLVIDPIGRTVKVRVAMELQPERLFRDRLVPESMIPEVMQGMVNKGLRAELDTASYVTGQQVITLAIIRNAKPAIVTKEGDAYVLPSEPGALGAIMASLQRFTDKLNKLPLQKLTDNLNTLLVTTNHTIATAQIQQTLAALTVTLNNANSALAGLRQSYGADSDFQRNLEQLMDQANQTLRSVDLLTAYLDRNPSALLRGRTGQ